MVERLEISDAVLEAWRWIHPKSGTKLHQRTALSTDPSPEQKRRHRRRREPRQPPQGTPIGGHVITPIRKRSRQEPAAGQSQALTHHHPRLCMGLHAHPGPKPPSPPACAAMAASIMPGGAKSSWPPSP